MNLKFIRIGVGDAKQLWEMQVEAEVTVGAIRTFKKAIKMHDGDFKIIAALKIICNYSEPCNFIQKHALNACIHKHLFV